MLIAVCTVLGLWGAPAALAEPRARTVPVVPTEIHGICGTLFGLGTSAASQNRYVAARGAGWVSLVIAAGCLLDDVAEYSRAFNASPEGRAAIVAAKARYSGRPVSAWMTDAGCTIRERRPAIADSVESPRRYWDCSRSPYAYAD